MRKLLKQANNDIFGILEFDNRVIYEPIVQAPDNDYYVRKKYQKRICQCRYSVSADGNIDSKNVVIYGHSSKWNNIIFTPLMNYVNQSYYKDHPIFHLTTENETRTYQIFGVINVDLNNLDDSLEFTQANWDSNNAFNASISDSINRELYKTGVTADSEDKIMTLVTCATRDNNKRIIEIAEKNIIT